MTTKRVMVGVIVDSEHSLTLEDLARACAADAREIEAWVAEGILEQPRDADRSAWRFDSDAVNRALRLRRLQNDFTEPLQAAAVMLDLLDEIDRLRGQLRRVLGNRRS